MHKKLLILVLSNLLGYTYICQASSVKDVRGHDVEIKKNTRLISLAPSVTEIIYEIKKNNLLIGVDSWSNFPKDATQKEQVGFFFKLNIEKIHSLKPDLVIGTLEGNNKSDVEKIEKLGIKTFTVKSNSIKEIEESISLIAKILDAEEESKRVVEKFNSKINCFHKSFKDVKTKKIIFAINSSPLFVVGGNNYIDEMITLVKGENIYKNNTAQRFPKVSYESVIRLNPEIVIASSQQDEKEWQKTFKNNKNLKIINADIISRPTIRILDGLNVLAKLIHPEVKINCE